VLILIKCWFLTITVPKSITLAHYPDTDYIIHFCYMPFWIAKCNHLLVLQAENYTNKNHALYLRIHRVWWLFCLNICTFINCTATFQIKYLFRLALKGLTLYTSLKNWSCNTWIKCYRLWDFRFSWRWVWRYLSCNTVPFSLIEKMMFQNCLLSPSKP
jgi:hypothetical protein